MVLQSLHIAGIVGVGKFVIAPETAKAKFAVLAGFSLGIGTPFVVDKPVEREEHCLGFHVACEKPRSGWLAFCPAIVNDIPPYYPRHGC